MSDSSSEEVVAPTKAAVKAAAVTADSDSSDEVAAPKAKAAAARPTFETDSEDESLPARPAPKNKAAVAEEDSSDDEVPATVVKLADKAKVVVGDSDSDDSDTEKKPVSDKKKSEWVQKKNEERQKKKAEKGASQEPKEKGSEKEPEWRVFIAGLPWKLTDEAVKKEFSKCGEVKSFKLMLDEQKRSKGMAFVTYATADGMKAALQRDGDVEKYPGRALKVSRAKSEKGPERKKEMEAVRKERKEDKKKAKQDELRETRLPDPAIVGEHDIITNSMIRKLTIAQEQKDYFVMEALGKKICKRARMSIEASAKQQTQKSAKKSNDFTVFVNGLPATNFDEEAFRKRFADCGRIKFLWKPVKGSGENKGFGTIAFKDDEAFQKALKYNGTKCGDNVLVVIKSVGKDDRKQEKLESNGKNKKDKKRKNVPDAAEVAPEAKKKKVEAVAEEPPRKDKSEKKAKKAVEVEAEEPVKKKKKAVE